MFSSLPQGKRNKGGRSSKWHQKLLRKWLKDPHCYYCRILTTIENRVNISGIDQVSNAATLDHVYSNLDIRRLLKGGDKTVLACYNCNNTRSAAEVRKVYPSRYDKRHNKVSIIDMLRNIYSRH